MAKHLLNTAQVGATRGEQAHVGLEPQDAVLKGEAGGARYLPMGYFNENSLGEITTITTNIMEQLGDVATRVVMLTTQGILNTAIIVLLILIFDWRIGLICIVGIVVFAFINRAMRKANEETAVKKVEVDLPPSWNSA